MVLDFLQPASLELFVGRDKIINAFRDTMRKYKTGSVEQHGWVITGDSGSGKTSMINLLERIAKSEGLTPIKWTVPLDDEMWAIPNRILESLQDRLTKKTQKDFDKMAFRYSPDLAREDSSYSAIINAMCEKFALINEELDARREYVVFLLDDVERIFLLGQDNLFSFLLDIIENFSQRSFKTFFVFALPREFRQQLQRDLQDRFVTMELERLDLKEAEILVQRREDSANRIDPQVVSEITKQTDRSPFSLVYTVTLLKEMKPEDELEIGPEIWEQVAPQLSEINFDVLGITPSEAKVLSLFSERMENFLRKKEIERAVDLDNTHLDTLLKEMEGKRLIIQGSAAVQLTSNALHQLLRQNRALDNNLAMVHALLNQIDFELNSELKPSIRLIERIEALAKALDVLETSRTYFYGSGSRAEQLAKHAFSKEFWYEAYAITELATMFFADLALDPERAAMTAEDMGKIFFDQARSKSGLLHYATKLYTLATNKYMQAEIDWKAKSTAREVAILYEQLGEHYEEEDMPGIARSQYYEAIQFFRLAEEPSRLERVIQKGKNVSKSPELALLFEK